MTELTDCGLIRCRLSTLVDADQAPHGTRIVQCLFHRRIEQVELVLQEMNAQPTFQTNRWAVRTFRLWAERLNHAEQIAPWNELIQLVKKLPDASVFQIFRSLRRRAFVATFSDSSAGLDAMRAL